MSHDLSLSATIEAARDGIPNGIRTRTSGGRQMKMVVLDARGLIGTKVVTAIRGRRHEAFAASPNVGVNIVTGEGLSQALEGAQVVIDIANPPSCQDSAALELVERCWCSHEP